MNYDIGLCVHEIFKNMSLGGSLLGLLYHLRSVCLPITSIGPHKKMKSMLRSCLDPYFSLLNFRHSIFITHYLSLITLKYQDCLAPSLTCHHSIFFILFVGSILVTRCSFFFSLPRNPNPVKKKNKKKKPRGED